MEKKTYNKLAPKVKTLFRFANPKIGNAAIASNTTVTTITTSTVISGLPNYIS